MKKTVLLAMFVLALTACERPKVESTPEESFMTQMYTMLNAGLAYDERCNGSKFITASDPNLFGNLSLIASNLYQAIYNTRTDKTKEDVEKQVKFQGQYALSRAKEVFDNKGCGSEEAQLYAKALALYTQTPPSGVSDLMDQQMQKGGITRAPKRP